MMSSESPHELSGTEAFAVEIAAIQPRLYGFILKRLADREQTLEVLQRTNLVLCRKADDFQHGSSFTAWAFTIAKFQVMAWRKSQGTSKLTFTDAVHEMLDRRADDEANAVDQRIDPLRRCLERLADEEQKMIQRRYRDGQKLDVLAQHLGKSVDSVGMRLTRIRRQLADCVRLKLAEEVSR